MTWTVKSGVAYAGIFLTILVAVLLVWLEVCAEFGISNPLDGTLIPPILFLASPLFLLVQVLAIFMANRSDLTGGRRVAAYLINILGAAMALWMVMMLFSLWKRGPINPG